MDEVGGASSWLHRVVQRDEQAWRELVDSYTPMVWGAARGLSLSSSDAEDVCQATWLLLAENLDRLREPEALPGWLATTARRESLRLIKARNREAPTDFDADLLERPDGAEGPEGKAIRSCAAARMWQAFAQLSQGCQQLLRVVAVAPEASYAQVSKALGLPRGTIGPRKSRCLRTLRERMAALGMPEEAAG